jgi:sRNA-binding regulator protein Hfq
MRKILSILVLALSFAGAADAVVVQKIFLKNGSVLSGYIQRQDNNGNMFIRSDNAIICLKSKDATISNEKNYNIKDLNKAWVDWAEKNDEFEGVGDNRTLLLADITTKAKSVTKVRVLERGEVVKYLEMTPNTYQISWKDVINIKGEKRSKTALSGINRIYPLKSGMEFEGQYAEENDSVITLYLNNGVRQSFKIDDMVKCTFRPINPNQDIFAQSELLDIVKTKNGAETKGVIIEQNYTSAKDSENYYLVQQQSGAIQSIKISDVLETRKEENPQYDPKFDILLKEGEVVINRQEVVLAKIKEEGDKIVFDSLSNKVVIAKDPNNNTKVTVEYRNANGSNLETYQVVRVTKATEKRRRETVSYYYFSYRDLVNATIRPVSLETSVNHTTKAEYIVGGEGVFALYDAQSRKAYPFTIK